MGYFKNVIIDIVDDYARGESTSKLADKYDLPEDDIQDIILKYYDSDLMAV